MGFTLTSPLSQAGPSTVWDPCRPRCFACSETRRRAYRRDAMTTTGSKRRIPQSSRNIPSQNLIRAAHPSPGWWCRWAAKEAPSDAESHKAPLVPSVPHGRGRRESLAIRAGPYKQSPIPQDVGSWRPVHCRQPALRKMPQICIQHSRKALREDISHHPTVLD